MPKSKVPSLMVLATIAAIRGIDSSKLESHDRESSIFFQTYGYLRWVNEKKELLSFLGACAQNNALLAHYYITQGSDFHEDDETPLITAASHGSADTVALLLEYGARITKKYYDSCRQSLLQDSLQSNLIFKLLKHCYEKEAYSLIEASRKNDIDKVKELLNKYDITLVTLPSGNKTEFVPDSQTSQANHFFYRSESDSWDSPIEVALITAAYFGYTEMVKNLLPCVAPSTFPPYCARPYALIASVEQSHDEITKFLIQAYGGFDLQMAVKEAIDLNLPKTLALVFTNLPAADKELLRGSSMETLMKENRIEMLLTMATVHFDFNYAAAAQFLTNDNLEKLNSLLKPSKEAYNLALIAAAKHCYDKAIEYLLNAGADITYHHPHGEDVLNAALNSIHSDPRRKLNTVNLLLTHGAQMKKQLQKQLAALRSLASNRQHFFVIPSNEEANKKNANDNLPQPKPWVCQLL